MDHLKKAKNDDFLLSKSLSWLLRHGAIKEKIKIYPNGFVNINDILSHKKFNKYTIDDIRRIVESNDKQRFTLREDPETKSFQIRANQGHSFDVEDLELVPILDPLEYPSVIHGTYFRFWGQIKSKGLSRMNRNHIHFALGLPEDKSVISGMRQSVEIYIYIDLKKALDDGLKFFKSSNNVILSPGRDDKGFLEPVYFKKVVNVKTKELLDFAM